MSFEAWGSQSVPVVRFRVCGHVASRDEVDRIQEARDGVYVCPLCFSEYFHEEEEAFSRDYIPSTRLTWEPAVCTTSELLTTRTPGRGSDSASAQGPSPECSSLDDLLCAITCRHHPCDVNLQRGMLRPLRQPPCTYRHQLHVWKAVSLGSRVHGGCIALTQGDSVLLLSGYGAHFSNTTFTGGAIICAGPEFQGSFRKCTFDTCTFYVVHGASVTFSGCAWSDCPAAALIAHGPNTLATLTDCAFRTCGRCIIVEAHASAAVQSSSFGCSSVAVIVNDDGSLLACNDCIFHGKHHRLTPSERSILLINRGSACLRRCGVINMSIVVSGRTARLEVAHGFFQDSSQAIIVQNHANTSMREVSVHCSGDGMLSPMQMMANGDSRSASAITAGASPWRCGSALLQMSRCHVEHSGAAAVTVARNGRVALFRCLLESQDCAVLVGPELRPHTHFSWATIQHCCSISQGHCYMAHSQGAVMCVHGGWAHAAKAACVALTGATLAVADARLSAGTTTMERGPRSMPLGPYHGTVVISIGSSGAVLRCDIRGGLIGVEATDANAVRVKDTQVSDLISLLPQPAARTGLQPSPSVAFWCRGSHMVIEGGAVQNCRIGVDVTASETGVHSSVIVHDVTFRQYLYGVQVHKGCRAVVYGCRLLGHEGVDPRNFRDKIVSGPFLNPLVERLLKTSGGGGVRGFGLLFLLGSERGLVRGCSFAGHDVHVSTCASHGIHVVQCEFAAGSGAPRARSSGIEANASAMIDDCVFTGLDFGVVAGGARGGVTCSVKQCKFHEGVKVAVQAKDGAKMSVEGTDVRSAKKAMFVVLDSTIAAQDCVLHACEAAMVIGEGGGVLTASRVTARGGKWGVLAHQCFVATAGNRIASNRGAEVRLLECVLQAEQEAVFVSGQRVEADVALCELSSPYIGLVVMSGAVARVTKTTLKECGRGLLVGERDHELQELCEVCGHRGPHELRRAWEALVGASECTRPESSSAGCAHQGARACATIDEVAILGCKLTGLTVTPHGRVEASNVSVAGSPLGFEVACLDGREHENQFSDCQVVFAAGERGDAARGWRQIGHKLQAGFRMVKYAVGGVERVQRSV